MTFSDSSTLPSAKPANDQLEIDAERTALRECEAKIKAGLSTFVEVGNALMEIRDGKLYRETHGTFEAYCREKWGMSKSRANQLVNAAESVGNLTTIVVKPESESQVRPLAHLPPDQQQEVWAKAVEIGGGKPTAKDVQRAVVEVVPKEEPKRKRSVSPKLDLDRLHLEWRARTLQLLEAARRRGRIDEVAYKALAYIKHYVAEVSK